MNDFCQECFGFFQGIFKIFQSGNIPDAFHDIGNIAVIIKNGRENPIFPEQFSGQRGRPSNDGLTCLFQENFVEGADLVGAGLLAVKNLMTELAHNLVAIQEVFFKEYLVGGNDLAIRCHDQCGKRQGVEYLHPPIHFIDDFFIHLVYQKRPTGSVLFLPIVSPER